MKTLKEILAAANSLSAADRKELRSAVERLDKAANALVLNEDGEITFRLYRQSDSEQLDSLRRSLAIEEDYLFLWRLHGQGGQELNLAQVFLTLSAIAGESSQHLDDFKMAFSFPFAMDVIKGQRTFPYLLEVRNIRDSLYYSLRKIVERGDKRLKDHLVHQPFEDEFGRDEIQFFMSYFHGYLIGRWKTLAPGDLRPFVRRVPAALVILGCCEGEAFETQFESCEEFESAWQQLEKKVERESRRRQV